MPTNTATAIFTTPTSELSAVNIILSGIGEAPVNSLSDTTSDVAVALNILAEVSKEVQTEGWQWNTEDDYPLTPGDDGRIKLHPSIVRVHFRDPDDRELVIRGPQVMQGYWHLPDETASALRNGWLYTGDLAVMDEEGYFFIMDRKKDMVMVGGYNVYPREVDEVLLEHPDVLEGVSVGIPDGVRGEALKAYIVPRPGVELTKADIVGWCRQRLASYKVPRLVEFREELPKTIVGKVLRRALREEEMAKQAKKAARHAARQDGAATAKED